MIVFIDDSGDPGFKIDKGSSKAFVICCVIFDDELEAEKTAIAIKEYRREIGKSDKYEFKFNKSSRQIREGFLRAVRNQKFRFRAIVMEKKAIQSPELKNKKESFYNYTVKLVLKHSFGTIKNAKVKIDGSGDREFVKNLVTYLRKNLNNKRSSIISDIKIKNSKNNVLIQLADMIAGSVNRSTQTDKTDCKTYLNIIKKRKEDIWYFK
jgi:hypothetical protein